MVAMAGGTCRRAEVTADGQRVVVDAGAVLRKLVRGDGVSLHVRSVRMAARARLGNVQWVDLRTRVARRPQTMNAMAINANRDFRIALCEKLAVHAGFVLGKLISPQRRIVFAHETRVGVAATAKGRNLAASDFAAETGSLAHGIHVCLRGIPAMATRAGQSFLSMDVTGELFLRHLKRRVQCRMAIRARARCLCVCHPYKE